MPLAPVSSVIRTSLRPLEADEGSLIDVWSEVVELILEKQALDDLVVATQPPLDWSPRRSVDAFGAATVRVTLDDRTGPFQI
jgi:hypothetical protein